MKKSFAFIMMICLIALLVGALVACDPASDPSNPYDGPEDPTGRTYTVTFDTNGATVVPEALLSPITGVKYGDKIPQPLVQGTNDPAEPYKKGYTFLYWTVDGTQFNFATSVITGPTTLRAFYEANKFYHFPDIYTTWKYDVDEGKYVADPLGHAIKKDGVPQYVDGEFIIDARGQNVLDDRGEPMPRPQAHVALGDADYKEDSTTFVSVYGSTPSKNLSVPTKLTDDGTVDDTDKFCFWYYMAEDKDGNKYPVQFTDWATSGSTTVQAKKITYDMTFADDKKGITLYAMFESDLPKVTVEYYKHENDADPVGSKDYPLNANVPEEDAYVFDASAEAGKDFDHWYFVYTTKDKDDNDVRNEEKFVFEQRDEDGNATNKDATSPMDAAHPDPEDVPEGEINFRPVTLKLYAKWVRKIMISDASTLSTIRDEYESYIEAGNTEALDELLHAKISFATDAITLNGTFKPLFDADHPFVGVIDGGQYDATAENAFTGNGKIIGGNFEGTGHASVFGYVNGTVKNITFENISVTANVGEKDSDVVYLGTVASALGGEIEHCTVTGTTFALGSGVKKAAIGGIAAILTAGTDGKNGSVNECAVSATFEKISLDGIYIGGVAGKAAPSTSISSTTAEITLQSVSATGVQGTDIGAWIGGLVGENSATVAKSSASMTVTAFSSRGRLFIGGLLGQSTGAVSQSHATFKFGEQAAPSEIGCDSIAQKVAVGGLIGQNGGSVINSYGNVTAFVKVARSKATPIYVGGLIGENRADRDDNQSGQEVGVGAINRSYSAGDITISVDESVKDAHLYVGGVVGYSEHSKFARNFTVVDITIDYATEDAELINAGFLFGKLATSAVFTSGYYGNDNRIKIGDKEYAPQAQSEPAEGEEQPEQKDEVGRLGKPVPNANFADKDFLFGTASDQLGWIGGKEENNIWQLEEGAQLPTLV